MHNMQFLHFAENNDDTNRNKTHKNSKNRNEILANKVRICLMRIERKV